MLEFTYSISAKERLAFEAQFQAEFAGLWAPMRSYSLLRAVFAMAAAAWFFIIIPRPEHALAVFSVAFLFFWAFQSANQKITSRAYLKFLEGLPGVGDYRTYVDGGYLVTENRGCRIGFPLSSVSKISTRDEFLYIDFSMLGRVRIPLSAFPSEALRLEFEGMLEDGMRT